MNYEEQLRYVGNLKQLCGVERRQICEGKADGIRLFEVHNAAGLSFDVLESRCLDIYGLRYKGINVPFLAKPGLVSSANSDLHGVNFLRSIGGGMFYTCGFSTVGAECSDENGEHIFHGRLRFTPAQNAYGYCRYQNGDYRIGVSGEMRDTALFKENLLLSRTIETTLNSKEISVLDEVTNEGFKTESLMLMYHINIGYPLLSEKSAVYIPSSKVIPMNEPAQKEIDKWQKTAAPSDDFCEHVFTHDLYQDENGLVHAGMYNKELGLGIKISFLYNDLPKLIQWKCMRSGDYVLGLQPANCMANGKDYELKNGIIKYIKPFEKKTFGFNLRILDGEEDLSEFIELFEKCRF